LADLQAVRSANRLTAIVVSVVALLIALLVWGSGIDRLSRSAPRLARATPESLRHYAWRLESARALEARQPNRAVTLAQRGVVADPIDPGAISTLAVARLLAGDARGAAAAIRVSGSLGWRDQPTQLYWLSSATQGKDYRIAAERLDAILRQNPAHPQKDAMLASLERSKEGRRALARVLALKPGWLATYLVPDENTGGEQLAARALVFKEPELVRARISCDEIATLTNALSARNRLTEASALWRSHCGDRRAILSDGGFEHVQLRGGSPFDWQFPGEGGLSVRLEPVRGSRAALVETALASTRVFAIQALQMPAEAYQLSWRATNLSGGPSSRLRVRVTCNPGSGDYLLSHMDEDGLFSTAAVSKPPCPLPWLELSVSPGSGTVVVDDINAIAAS
jgi:hypothetical protein